MELKHSKYAPQAKIGIGIQFGFAFGVLLLVCLLMVVNPHSFRVFGFEWIKSLSVLGAIIVLPPSFGILVSDRVFHSTKINKDCYLLIAAVILILWSCTCYSFARLFWHEYSLAFVLINALLAGILANFAAGIVSRKESTL